MDADLWKLKMTHYRQNATAWFAMTAVRLYRLCCPFGEVQQDFFLSSLTIGQAYCLMEVLQ
jgi:hypothetical protein